MSCAAHNTSILNEFPVSSAATTCTVYMYVYLFANKTLTWVSEI